MTCCLCESDELKPWASVPESMFGWSESFDYVQCAICGTLQIKKIPEDLSKYYPLDRYYSYKTDCSQPSRKDFLKRKLMQHVLGERNLWGVLYRLLRPYPRQVTWFQQLPLNFEDPILDVGCGAGEQLKEMARVGFQNLTGVDKYLPSEIQSTDGPVTLLSGDLSQIKDTFQLIMWHHSWEHVPHPLENLQQVDRLLKPGGVVLIRVPVADSEVCHLYREYWIQIDPPRHIFIPTKKAMGLLAKQMGWDLFKVVDDSTGYQFWASEQNKKGIPYRHAKSYVNGLKESLFTQQEIDHFEREAQKFNQLGKGDQACFYFRKPFD